MRAYRGDGFAVEPRWKEEVVYWEGDLGFVLDAGWGVDPPVLHVPSDSDWAQVAPPWLRGRRDVVLRRLREHSGHALVVDADGGRLRAAASREVRRSGEGGPGPYDGRSGT